MSLQHISVVSYCLRYAVPAPVPSLADPPLVRRSACAATQTPEERARTAQNLPVCVATSSSLEFEVGAGTYNTVYRMRQPEVQHGPRMTRHSSSSQLDVVPCESILAQFPRKTYAAKISGSSKHALIRVFSNLDEGFTGEEAGITPAILRKLRHSLS